MDNQPNKDTFSTFPDVNDGISVQTKIWFLLILSLLLYYLWEKKLSGIYKKWKETQEINLEREKKEKDPDTYLTRERARMASVEKFQKEYNENLIKMTEIAKEREEKKRQEFILKHGTASHGRKLNEDYNPLMTQGGPSYRAPRRTCPGGSCGNR